MIAARYGRAIKLGIIEDTTNRGRLAKLLRIKTSGSGDEFTTLDQYIERMKVRGHCVGWGWGGWVGVGEVYAQRRTFRKHRRGGKVYTQKRALRNIGVRAAS